MATTTDPADAIQSRIDELKQDIEPQTQKITEIMNAAQAEAEQVRAGIRDTEDEISRLEMAAAALRGEVPTGSTTKRRSSGTRARRGSLPSLDVTEEQVVGFLKDQSEPVSAGQIREHFGVPQEISNKLSVLLGGLSDTDQIKREGERRGTRYSAK